MSKEYSDYQQKIISRYYENLDTITLARLQELVSQLYLAESPAKQNQLWKHI